MRWQLATGGFLDLGEHIGRAAAGEIARNDIRRQRETGADELLRYDGRCQRFAVDKNAVAIEDNHGLPR